MQKVIIPASFLSAAVPAETTVLKGEEYMYIVRENKKKQAPKVSNLYSIFFGAQEAEPGFAKVPNQAQNTGPDYYSSYE
jgi:hypothetical protein